MTTVVNVELSESWEEAARSLLEERGLEDHVRKIVGDFVDESRHLPDVDLVVLHRVGVLLSRLASDARRRRGQGRPARGHHRAGRPLVDPHCRPDRDVVSASARYVFRAYVHPPEAMMARMRADGLSVVRDQSRWAWRWVVTTRWVMPGSRRVA